MSLDPKQERLLKEYVRGGNAVSSNPPAGFPPERAIGAGSRSPTIDRAASERVHGTSRLFDSVWKIILVLATAAGTGWGARGLAGDYVTVQGLKPIQDDIKTMRGNIADIGTTQQGMQTEIAVLKTRLGLMTSDQISGTRPPR